MKIGSMFSGVGGLDLAVEAVFHAETIWQAEWEDAPSKVLATHWPGVHNYRDVTQVDWPNIPPVDIITGGFPCQDVSLAGRRAGMTEGTRSNLWGAMRTAIETIQPRYVVAENVRGLLSAKAASDSDMEPGQGPMGDDGPPNLRAIGRVLADLSDIGYDAQWCGLRAADVGAPHGRFRVFILAERRDVVADPGGIGRVEAVEHHGRGSQALNGASIPNQPDRELVRTGPNGTPTSHTDDQRGDRRGEWSIQDGWGQSAHGRDATADTTCIRPRYNVECGRKGVLPPAESGGKGGLDWGAYAPAIRRWEQLRGPAPTPTDAEGELDGNPTQGRPGEVLQGVRQGVEAKEVREAARGSERLPAEDALRSVVREHSPGGDTLGPSISGATPQEVGLRGMRDESGLACSPQGQKLEERCSGESPDALRKLPPQAALARGQGTAPSSEPMVAWGPYEPAIRRWEGILGRQSPDPTELTPRGKHRLSAHFVEFMMGLPAGWVTDIDISRNEQLKALGNGVVPQQAHAALTHMLNTQRMENAA